MMATICRPLHVLLTLAAVCSVSGAATVETSIENDIAVEPQQQCVSNDQDCVSATSNSRNSNAGNRLSTETSLKAPALNKGPWSMVSQKSPVGTNNNNHQAAETLLEEQPSSPVYTAFDDASWGVSSTNMTTRLGPANQAFYNEFIRECIALEPTCQEENEDRVYMNVHQPPSVHNYTSQGFKKIRAPPELYQLLKDFWDQNKDKAEVEYNDAGAYHNTWKYPTHLVMVEDDKYEGGGWNLSAAIWNSARDILEDWTGQKLSGSSVYGIRVYQNQSVLAPHVDRLPLISSAIINVDQDVDEDWFLEVYGHDGKATNVTMKPGDMVLYESHSVIHGRPYPLNGKFYANVFVHFEPMGETESSDKIPESGGLPPYLKEGSDWEDFYWDEFPEGWELLSDVRSLAHRGDLYTLKYVAQREQDAITNPKVKCAIMAAAAKAHQMDVLEWIFGDMKYDVNEICHRSFTVLDVAQERFDANDEVFSFLKALGAQTKLELTGESSPSLTHNEMVLKERCQTLATATANENLDVLDFLINSMDYEINMVCGRWHPTSQEHTILELAYDLFDDEGTHKEVIDFLEDNGGVFLEELEDMDDDDDDDGQEDGQSK